MRRIKPSIIGCANVALVFMLCVLTTRYQVYAQDLGPAFDAVGASLVWIEVGSHEGTGFVIHSSAKESMILTAAHVLGIEPGSPAKPVTGVSVYWLHHSKSHLASNITVPQEEIDTEHDLALIRVKVPNLHVTCMGDETPGNGTSIGLAAFSQRQVRGRDYAPGDESDADERLGETWPTVRGGVLGQARLNEVEYFIPSEKGFSGGPIFDARTGVAFGVVQGQAEFVGAAPMATQVTKGFGRYVRSFVEHDEIPELVSSLLMHKLMYHYPDISRRGRFVMLDLPSSGKPLSPELNNRIEYVLQSALRNRLDIYYGGDSTEVSGADISPFVPGEPKERTELRANNYLELCNQHNAVAVIAIKRIYSADGPDSVQFQFAYQDCIGTTYKKALSPVFHHLTSLLTFDNLEYIIADMSKHIEDSFLADQRDADRFLNFKTYGIFLADGEHRSFFSLHRLPSGTVIATDVLPSGTAYWSGLRDGNKIYRININGVGAWDFLKDEMTDDQLNALIHQAEIDEQILSVESDGAIARHIIRPFNLCGYLNYMPFGINPAHYPNYLTF